MDNVKSTKYFVINRGSINRPSFCVYRLTEFDPKHSEFKHQLDYANINFNRDLNPKNLFTKTTSLEQAEQIVKSRLESTTFDWIKFTEYDLRSTERFEDLVDHEKCGLTVWSVNSRKPNEVSRSMNRIFENQFTDSIQKLIDLQNLTRNIQTEAKIDGFDSTPITLSKGFAEWAITIAGQYLGNDEVGNEFELHLLRTMLNTPEISNLDIHLREDD